MPKEKARLRGPGMTEHPQEAYTPPSAPAIVWSKLRAAVLVLDADPALADRLLDQALDQLLEGVA